MTEMECPGPHQFCKGCRGQGTVQLPTLFVSRSGDAGELMASHKCMACHGRGFFCKEGPPCTGKHQDGTPAIAPDAVPPV
ncbi:hypothetical protein AF335_28145 [Streptomyces eurocidicus]|uniref:DnaJ-class molecular chaperone n=1 Tax=Streptomyces eurocidicus TaxID=66423 RepID=A0A2N8NPH8_STREU|nr:DnaJ-class molecular chaperone [Streptomyces eurocidicus]PNE30672.1 hypothetical protein AF335_28145 [Streptomyces eurocidicus]